MFTGSHVMQSLRPQNAMADDLEFGLPAVKSNEIKQSLKAWVGSAHGVVESLCEVRTSGGSGREEHPH